MPYAIRYNIHNRLKPGQEPSDKVMAGPKRTHKFNKTTHRTFCGLQVATEDKRWHVVWEGGDDKDVDCTRCLARDESGTKAKAPKPPKAAKAPKAPKPPKVAKAPKAPKAQKEDKPLATAAPKPVSRKTKRKAAAATHGVESLPPISEMGADGSDSTEQRVPIDELEKEDRVPVPE